MLKRLSFVMLIEMCISENIGAQAYWAHCAVHLTNTNTSKGIRGKMKFI